MEFVKRFLNAQLAKPPFASHLASLATIPFGPRTFGQMSEQVTMVDVPTAQAWIEAGDAVVVDVREQHEYDAGHIKGATLLPLSVWDPDALPEVPVGKHLLLHCRSASRCGVAAQSLIENGYQGPINRLAGGLLAWVAAGAPVETA
jgi:rhodanese-related sulfurtransferase